MVCFIWEFMQISTASYIMEEEDGKKAWELAWKEGSCTVFMCRSSVVGLNPT